MFVIVAIIFTACSTPHTSDLPCSAGSAAEGICWKVLQLHESERILKQQICIVIFKFGAGIQSCLFKRIYLRLHPSWSIEHSVNLCFKRTASMFLKFFCSPVLLYELQNVGATAFPSKRQTRFEVSAACFEFGRAFFFCLFCFLDLLHPLKTTTKRKMHTPIQQMTDKPIVIILKNKNKT